MRQKQGTTKWAKDNEEQVFAPTRDWLARYRSADRARTPASDAVQALVSEQEYRAALDAIGIEGDRNWMQTALEAAARARQAVAKGGE